MDATGFTLPGMLRTLASTAGDRAALTEGTRTVTFDELDRRTSSVAATLVRAGVSAGDRVAVVSRNSLAYLEAVFGITKAGATVAGVNFRLAPPEVEDILLDAESRMVVVADELAHLVRPERNPISLDHLVGSLEELADPGIPVHSGGIALQLYSSGTTGAPKGAMLTHASLAWTVRMGREVYAMGPGSVNLLTSPLFHIGGAGYGLTTLGQGGETVVTSTLEAGAVLDLIEAHRVTHAFLVPTVIRGLLDNLPGRPADLSSLQVVAYGAAPIDDRTLLEAIEAFGCRFLGVYGMTETAGSVAALVPGDHDPGGPRSHLLRSVGRGLDWHEVAVVDPATGSEAATGVVGEIWVRSPQNMAGYWGQPALTAATLVDGGWLRTGDAAWRDADGYLYVHDRVKDMIISGGENVYPAEVERVLAAHPAVGEVAVVGVPDLRWGETVKAIVVLLPAATVSSEELIDFTRARLAHFKCPTSVDFVDALVRNASGKILKRTMRAAYWPADLAGPRP